MNPGTLGSWLPVWLLGAPLLFGVIEWLRAPKATTRDTTSRPATPLVARPA